MPKSPWADDLKAKLNLPTYDVFNRRSSRYLGWLHEIRDSQSGSILRWRKQWIATHDYDRETMPPWPRRLCACLVFHHMKRRFWRKKVVRDIVTNGRFYGLDLLIRADSVNDLPPDVRDQVDHVIVCNMRYRLEMRKWLQRIYNEFPPRCMKFSKFCYHYGRSLALWLNQCDATVFQQTLTKTWESAFHG